MVRRHERQKIAEIERRIVLLERLRDEAATEAERASIVAELRELALLKANHKHWPD